VVGPPIRAGPVRRLRNLQRSVPNNAKMASAGPLFKRSGAMIPELSL
jgi:hypothetical protein